MGIPAAWHQSNQPIRMKSVKLCLMIGSVFLFGLPSPSKSAPTDLFLLDVSFSWRWIVKSVLDYHKPSWTIINHKPHQDLFYHGAGGIGLGLAGGLLTAGVSYPPLLQIQNTTIYYCSPHFHINLIFSQHVWTEGGGSPGTRCKEGEDQNHCKRCQLKGWVALSTFTPT